MFCLNKHIFQIYLKRAGGWALTTKAKITVLRNSHQNIRTSKADNTAKQYRYAFNTFCKWCNSFNPVITPLPASETNFALYIIHLAKQYKSSGKIYSAAHAISWAHSLAGYGDPCDSVLVKNIKEGAIRETSKTGTKKEPFKGPCFYIWKGLQLV